MIGATIVLVQDGTKGTVTNMDGAFQLDGVPADGTLRISYVGMRTLDVPINGQTDLSIVLHDDQELLDEVVVVGYGTQKKANLTGAVAAINGEDIAKRPVANAQVMLQGQVPGLRVNQGYGQPGSEGVSFRIRGQGTFSSAGSDPLILINGVPGDMSALDPSVIESVSVLKDAASAAIYGARAANGVILITTKEGTQGKTHISYHGNVGLHSATRLYDRVTNSVEYMELANLARKNSGQGEVYPSDFIDAYRKNSGSDKYPSFDWQGYMFRTATVQNHNINVTGGTEKATYNVSLNFVDQPGTMRGFDYKKYNTTVDFTAKLNDFMRFGTYTNMMYAEIDQPRQGQSDAFLSTLSQAPTYMPWLPDDGSGVKKWTASARVGEEHNKNMVGIIADNAMRRQRNFDINTQMWLEINPVKGLTWHTKGATRLRSGKTKDWIGSPTPIYNYHSGEQSGTLDKGGAGLTVSDSRVFYTNFYTYLRYDLALMEQAHKISAMLGYNQENEKTETLGAYRKEYAFNLPTINAGGQANWSNNGDENEWAIQSLFGRLNYNYKERYLFEANVRYDGTSRISEENRWGIFPSFSGAWRVTEEPFMQALNYGWLNNLKLRASWGQLGNQNIGLYPYQAMIAHVSDYPFTKTTDGVVTSYQQTAYANRNIKWETTTITDVGFDLQVLKGLSLTKRTRDNFISGNQASSPEIMFSVRYLQPNITNSIDLYYGAWACLNPTTDLVNAFECTDGKKWGESPLTVRPDESVLYSGDASEEAKRAERAKMFQNRDERLYDAIVHTRHTSYELDGLDGATNVEVTELNNASHTGFGVKKLLQPMRQVADYSTLSDADVVIMRYAHVLLMIAEAENEANGPTDKALQAINHVRVRSHQPPIAGGISQDELRTRIRNEWRVETCFEGLRYFQLKRWKLLQKLVDGAVDPAYPNYKKVVKPAFEFFPLPQTEVDKAKGILVQDSHYL